MKIGYKRSLKVPKYFKAKDGTVRIKLYSSANDSGEWLKNTDTMVVVPSNYISSICEFPNREAAEKAYNLYVEFTKNYNLSFQEKRNIRVNTRPDSDFEEEK